MNEELMMQHSVQNQLQPEPKGHPWLKRLLVIVVVLVLVGGIGYGAALAWRQYSNVQDKLASEQAKNKELAGKNSQLQTQIADRSSIPKTSLELLDGKTISYPLTTDSAQILLWEENGAVQVSDRRAVAYVASLTGDTRMKLCGMADTDTFTQASVNMGTFDTTTKKLVTNQAPNCLQAMASGLLNTDAVSQAAAKAVLDTVNNAITQFTSDVTVQ